MNSTSNGFDRRPPTASYTVATLWTLRDELNELMADAGARLRPTLDSSDLGFSKRLTWHFSGSIGTADIVPAVVLNAVSATKQAAEVAHVIEDLNIGRPWTDELHEVPSYDPQSVSPTFVAHVATARSRSESDELSDWYARLDDDR